MTPPAQQEPSAQSLSADGFGDPKIADVDGAKRLVGAPARQLRGDAQGVLSHTEELLGCPAALRKRAEADVDRILVDLTVRQLNEIPVTSLKGSVARGTRLGILQKSRYRTLADVLAASPAALTTLPGLGSGSAMEIFTAATATAQSVRTKAVIRFDTEQQPPLQTALLRTLTAIRRADRAVSAMAGASSQLSSQLAPLLPHSARATSRARMFFTGRTNKNVSLVAIGRLDRIMSDPRVVQLQASLMAAMRDIDPNSPEHADPWPEYRRDAAALNSLLATIPGANVGDDSEAGYGYIPVKQIRETQAVELDQSLMRSALRGYQAFGARFAILQSKAIIGDEMGLGKSIQAIAVAAHLAAHGDRLFLVVCPASVIINWRNEIGTHSHLESHLLHGADRDEATRAWLNHGGIAVTTFGTLGRLLIPGGVDLALVIVDEAHLVKNPLSQRSQSVSQVIAKAKRTVFLTGTPMENRVEEFRILVKYLKPRLAASIDARDAVAGAKVFRRAVAPAYLRRNQIDVLRELPDKIEVEDWVTPTAADQQAYADAALSGNFMAMRQAGYAAAVGRNSAKFERLLEIVDEAAVDGRKVIVFSYFLGVLEATKRALGDRAVGPLTGTIPAARRQEMVDGFTNRPDPCVLISQIEAGGVGLNIQAASVVILTEPQWKPSTEVQAIARAHRMGQVDRVLVHRLLAKDSVDERMREILQHKTSLFDAYARPSDAKAADARAVDAALPATESIQPSANMMKKIVTVERRRLGLE